ncbi:hypothetical protein BLNAU_8094 [Blattamonas nauphoetae]|uniref:Uncharacterized protein n=1 Tax=Blattamonas nauphoetae TaxID=2049346 RepID=A0ABQ9XZY5_9EUKA|nr:hypothetical protein BLNAU_8094 [Blattamonas nauphoetae]
MDDQKLSVDLDFHTASTFDDSGSTMFSITSQCIDTGSQSTLRPSSSELVPFAGWLCSTLAEHVSEMKSLFSESSPSDGTNSALSATLPAESQLLNGNALLEILCEEFNLVNTLLVNSDYRFEDILNNINFIQLLKSTIIACLNQLEQKRTVLTRPPAGRADLLIKILDWSWKCASDSIPHFNTLYPVVKSTFSDVPQLCSLLERTCHQSSPTHFSHFRMITSIGEYLPHLITRLLDENLVERVMDTSKPMVVPTSDDDFHDKLIWVVLMLIWTPKDIAVYQKKKRKRIRKMQFEHALKPAKQYLLFILQREVLMQKGPVWCDRIPHTIGHFLHQTLILERDLFEDGEIVETGREEWEAGWLVERPDEYHYALRLEDIRKDDEIMKKDEKSRWKKRVERQRKAGHEDAIEGWLMRKGNGMGTMIVKYLESVREETIHSGNALPPVRFGAETNEMNGVNETPWKPQVTTSAAGPAVGASQMSDGPTELKRHSIAGTRPHPSHAQKKLLTRQSSAQLGSPSTTFPNTSP